MGSPESWRANQSGWARKRSSAARLESMRASTVRPSACAACREFAEEIAAVQELGAMVQRKLAGVIRHDSARVDDHALNRGLLPIRAPPRDVVASGIALCNVGLSPAGDAAVPGNGAFRRRRCGRGREIGLHKCTPGEHSATIQRCAWRSLGISQAKNRFDMIEIADSRINGNPHVSSTHLLLWSCPCGDAPNRGGPDSHLLAYTKMADRNAGIAGHRFRGAGERNRSNFAKNIWACIACW